VPDQLHPNAPGNSTPADVINPQLTALAREHLRFLREMVGELAGRCR
jgi:hypothetical protein